MSGKQDGISLIEKAPAFSKCICQTFPQCLPLQLQLSGAGEAGWGGCRPYLGGGEVRQPPVDVQRVPAGRQAALLQRPQLRRRPGAARDHLVEIEPQGGGILVGALVLRDTRKGVSQGCCR